MAHLIVWSRRAMDDLDEIVSFIYSDSPAYAAAVARTILRKVAALTQFPHVGRIVPEFSDQSIREIFVYSYRVIYRVENEEIAIAAVVHGKRLLDFSLHP